MEKTIELEISELLPGVENDRDECLNRLEKSFQGKQGIIRSHLKRDNTPVDLCLHYDPSMISLNDVKRLASQAGISIVNRYHHESIPVEGMDCSDCVVVLEHSVGRLEGVLSVNVNYAAEKMWLEYDSKKINRKEIEKYIHVLGYKIPLDEKQARLEENRELISSLAAGLLVLLGWLGGLWLGFPHVVSIGLYLAAYILGGWDVAIHAWHAVRQGHFDTDLLMIIAAIGAAILGDFAEGGLLLFLFSLGHALEERALEKAQKAVKALADLTPKTALVRRDEKEIEVPVDEIQLGEIAVVKPAVRIPVDGVIMQGSSAVDQAPVTGESLPVEKAPGDQVFAGTINGEGALEVKVNRLAKDSTLARIMEMVEEAQAQKSITQQTVEKFERIFVPVILILTAAVIAIPPILGFPFQTSFLRAMTLLVAASPCALALGTPSAVLSGIAQAARNGVLVKGGVHLENLGLLKAVAFDKTGTITSGHPQVTDVIVPNGIQDEVLALVAGVESRSAHPLAKPVVQYVASLGIDLAEAGNVESLSGMGLRALVQGKTAYIGSQALMQAQQVEINSEYLQRAEALQFAGKTIIWAALDGKLIGLLALADTMRPEAASAMRALHQIGVEHTIMLTGDNPQAAGAIAAQVGISDFRANLMPEDKLVVIRSLVEEYQQVAMIGDGVNDAPALANSTVGIAMGGAGTDVALETADVVLMGDDLSRLPFAVGLGRETRRIIVQNLVIALGVIAVLIITSLTGWMSIGPAVVFHEGSTILVVLNSLRLLRYK